MQNTAVYISFSPEGQQKSIRGRKKENASFFMVQKKVGRYLKVLQKRSVLQKGFEYDRLKYQACFLYAYLLLPICYAETAYKFTFCLYNTFSIFTMRQYTIQGITNMNVVSKNSVCRENGFIGEQQSFHFKKTSYFAQVSIQQCVSFYFFSQNHQA